MAEESDGRTRDVVDYVSGESKGTACDSFESREFSVGLLCYVARRKRPALEDESLCSKSEHALWNPCFVSAVGSV